MRAASRNSLEIVAMPAMYIAMENPVSCQAAATTTGIRAIGIPHWIDSCLMAGKTLPSQLLSEKSTEGSVVQPGFKGGPPKDVIKWLMPSPSNKRLMPVSGLKIQRQAIPVTMKE